MQFSAAYLSTAIPSVPFIFSFFLAAHRNTALLTIFFFVCLFNKPFAAHRTFCRIFRFHQFNMQFLVQRQDGSFEPFTDNMRVGNRLRTGAVQQNTIPVIVVAALTSDKGVYPPALLRLQPYNGAHRSGGECLGGFFGSLRSPRSFCACRSLALTEGFLPDFSL